MAVTLTIPRSKPSDNDYTIIAIGINYPNGRVAVKIRFENGDEQDVIYEGAKLTAMRNRVQQFNGLRLALEQDIAANEPGFGGVAS